MQKARALGCMIEELADIWHLIHPRGSDFTFFKSA